MKRFVACNQENYLPFLFQIVWRHFFNDPRFGEAPRAYIVTKPESKLTTDEVKKFVEESAAPYKHLVSIFIKLYFDEKNIIRSGPFK